MVEYVKKLDIEPIISVHAQAPEAARIAAREDAAEFLSAAVVVDAGSRVSYPELYKAYREWCRVRGLLAESRRTFGAYIDAPRLKSNSTVWFLGIRAL